jgi:predicted transcriptional regulator
MKTKIVKIEVPLSWEEPEELNRLSPEENAFILDVGCETIKDARALVAGLSQQEIYNKIREESKGEIQKLEMDLLVQKELKTKTEQSLKESYENLLNEIVKKNDELKTQIIKYESQNKNMIREEVEKEIEKLASMTHQDLHDLYYILSDRVIYNQNLLRTFINYYPFQTSLDDIKKFYSN